MFVLANFLNKSDPQKNHLRFIYMTSALGGIMFGGGFAYYSAQQHTIEKLALWDPNWDKK